MIFPAGGFFDHRSSGFGAIIPATTIEGSGLWPDVGRRGYHPGSR
jgi:hypothetical protein